MGAIPARTNTLRIKGELNRDLAEFDPNDIDDQILAADLLKVHPEKALARDAYLEWLGPEAPNAEHLLDSPLNAVDRVVSSSLHIEAESRRNEHVRTFYRRQFAKGLDRNTATALVDKLKSLSDTPKDFDTYKKIGHALRIESPDHVGTWLSFSDTFRRFNQEEFEKDWDELFPRKIPPYCLGELVADSSVSSRITFKSVGEILDTEYEEERWHIEDFFAVGIAMLVIANMKWCKSMTMIYMGVELAYGGTFYGRKCRATKIVYFSAETKEREFRELVEAIIASKPELTPEQIQMIRDNFVFTDKHSDIPTVGCDWRPFQDAIREFGAGVVMLDPAYVVMPAEGASNSQQQGKALREIDNACTEAGATLVLAAHTKKGLQEHESDPVELKDVAWAGYAEWAPSSLTIRRKTKYKFDGIHELLISVGGRHNRGGMFDVTYRNLQNGKPFWSCDVQNHADFLDFNQQKQEVQKIIDATKKMIAKLKDSKKDSFTFSELRGFAGCTKDKERFENILADCLNNGTLTEIDHKSNGRRFTYNAKGGE